LRETSAYPGTPESRPGLRLKDFLFQQTFSRLFVYNILFEDSEVDERFFGLDEASRVLSISGAGCGVAGMLASHPHSIDAVDINAHHLALSALKVQAARLQKPYSSFYDLFGRGWLPQPGPAVSKLVEGLPGWMRRYWRANSHVFHRSLYGEGLTARVMHELRRRSGIDADWLRDLISQPIEARRLAIEESIAPVLRSPLALAITRSPIQLLALGVNYRQSERLQETEQMGLLDFFLHHIHRLAETDLRTNWFAWYFVTGQFHHDDKEGVPPYLRPDHYARSQQAPTDVRYHRRSFFDVLGSASARSWTHYSLLDAPDWLDVAAQERLLSEIRRTGRDGAIVLHRSVESESIFDRCESGRHFEELTHESALATALDRTRQYRRVAFHRLVH
jgi:S-adenosylmethionine-diacylglycerol 3-amino-3-carboxypropyl transferase